MEKPTEEQIGKQPKRFPRKVTAGKSKKTGRAKLRRKPHAMK